MPLAPGKLSASKRLLDLNRQNTAVFNSPEECIRRKKLLKKLKTEFGWLKCMDGRLNGADLTQFPMGIFHPYRNLGGQFNLGWPYFNKSMRNWVGHFAERRKRYCMPISTYHFDRYEPHRGCRGVEYDVAKGQENAAKLQEQFKFVFGMGDVYPLMMGIETYWDALILHGENGQQIDLSNVTENDSRILLDMIHELYPHMPARIARDFLRIVKGNIMHIQQIKQQNRTPAEIDHSEWALCVGRGFPWIHKPNTALIVGPYDLELKHSIAIAAGLLLDNVETNRTNPEEGLVLMTSAPYQEPNGPEPRAAEVKARHLLNIALEVITDKVPALLQYLEIVAAIMYKETMEVTVLEQRYAIPPKSKRSSSSMTA